MDGQPVRVLEARGDGLVCTLCRATTAVINSRAVEQSIRRRRKCLACGHRFTTYEFEADPLAAQKAVTIGQTIAAIKGLRDELTIALENMEMVGRVAAMTAPRKAAD